MSKVQHSVRETYQWPVALALITLCGLLFALFGDGVWDVASWMLLAVPLIVLVSQLVVSRL
jgi:uncharacterized membrane protein YjjP (DUF1212 family)